MTLNVCIQLFSSMNGKCALRILQRIRVTLLEKHWRVIIDKLVPLGYINLAETRLN